MLLLVTLAWFSLLFCFFFCGRCFEFGLTLSPSPLFMSNISLPNCFALFSCSLCFFTGVPSQMDRYHPMQLHACMLQFLRPMLPHLRRLLGMHPAMKGLANPYEPILQCITSTWFICGAALGTKAQKIKPQKIKPHLSFHQEIQDAKNILSSFSFIKSSILHLALS